MQPTKTIMEFLNVTEYRKVWMGLTYYNTELKCDNNICHPTLMLCLCHKNLKCRDSNKNVWDSLQWFIRHL